MTILYDRATISGKARITPQGYFVADALVARANNIQDYRASELGLTDRDPNAVVRVFRPEAEVFAVDSLKSASRLPVTLDHPPVMVDATNWREYAKGETGEELLRDGEFLRVPLRVTDAAAVSSVTNDRQEFSLGYTAEIKFEAGVHDGQAYDAVATNLRYNHLAACRTARGGPELRIVDERPAPIGGTPMPKTMMIDGFAVNLEDATATEAALRKLSDERGALATAVDQANAKVAELNTTIAARDAEIVGLKDAADKAKLSPQQLRDAAASYARTTAKAKALGATLTDEMDEGAIMAAAVTHKMGDAAKAYTPEQVAAAFDVLSAGVSDAAAPVADALRDTIKSTPVSDGDGAKAFADARNARFNRFANGHRNQAQEG
jgi:uncharacterized protein